MIGRIKGGRTIQTEDIFEKYGKMVYRYLLVLCKNVDLAQELTQETFYQAIKSIDRYDGSCSMSTFVEDIRRKSMESKTDLSCDIVKDLLPVYCDGQASSDSVEAVEEHLKQCQNCKKMYEEMSGNLELEQPCVLFYLVYSL